MTNYKDIDEKLIAKSKFGLGRRNFLKAGLAGTAVFAVGLRAQAVFAATTTMALPSNFGWTPLVKILKNGPGQYDVDKTASDLKPGGVIKKYYVDTAKGNNASAGTTTSPLQSVYVALAKADGGVNTLEILVRPLPSRILWGTRGFTPTSTPTRNIIVRAEDGGELIMAKTASSAPPVWLSLGNGTFTTKAGIGSNNSSPPTDWNPSQRANTPDGFGRAFNAAASAAAVVGKPGSYFHDIVTGLVTICPFDGRNLIGDQYVIPPCLMGANGAFNIRTVSLTMWLDRCTFVGGSPFYAVNQVTGARGTLVMNRCNFYASSNAAGTNGIGLSGAYDAYLFDCGEGLSWSDGFGFHGNSSGQPRVVLIRPSHKQYSGRSNRGSDNVFTSHESGRMIVVMPKLTIGAKGRTAGVIDSAWMIFYGGRLSKSLLSDNQSSTVHTGSVSKCNLYEVVVENSTGPYTYHADDPSVIYAHGMNTSGQTKGGIVKDLVS